MPLEHALPDAVQSIAERRDSGRAIRKVVPRSLHAPWKPSPTRRDPVQLLIDNDRHRLSHLLPVRYGRMRASASAFLRGAAVVMAADLAETPSSGLRTQCCGDCHLANFGTFAASEGTPVFDINDFDETLPAPFEWDLKRLAASIALDGLDRGLSDKTARQLARGMVQSYRERMTEMVKLPPLQGWRTRVDVTWVLNGIDDARLRARELKRLQQATEAAHKGYPKLIERRKNGWRFRAQPPVIIPLSGQSDDTFEQTARSAFESYRVSLPEEKRLLVNRYELTDVAFKVVDVGSVGTFCAIGLLVTRDEATLLLEMKEACLSVLSPYAGASLYANQGQRVVVGQRIMQTTPDIFLGWTDDPGDDQHCYVRQLKDHRLALVGSDPATQALPHHAALCGATLARAHARSGDAACIAGYTGSGSAFDAAIAEFALRYAAQVQQDWRLFLEAIKAGVIEARDE